MFRKKFEIKEHHIQKRREGKIMLKIIYSNKK